MSVATHTLTFLGATRTVTGSKYLLDLGARRILLDAGMFQGEKQWRLKNWEDFPVPPESITDIVLTHAHMDHCGYLPALVKLGFDGPVWCTAGTRDLAAIVLRDAGFLAERDARDAAEGGWSKHHPPLPIYTMDDVERALPLLTPVDYDRDAELGDEVTVRFTRAGHILGSASVTVASPGGSVLFSGDLGRHDHPVLKPRDTPPGADVVVIESTYGDREHPEPRNLAHEGMADAIRRTVERGGSVLIPAFAIDRTEIVLRVLAEMRQTGRIPEHIPIYVNSPMATAALAVYRRDSSELRSDLEIDDFTKISNVHEVHSAEESAALTRGRASESRIVISSSGMLNGGRVLHHLERMLPDARNAIILTGYQAVGTRGRALIEGATQVKMHGSYVPVRAEIVADKEFSVHADASDLIDWLRDLDPRPRTIYTTHGEEHSSEALAARIRSELHLTAVVPHFGEKVRLSAGPRSTEPAEDSGEAQRDARAAEPTGAASAAGADALASGQVVASDLRVRSRSGDTVVLEGTITLRLN